MENKKNEKERDSQSNEDSLAKRVGILKEEYPELIQMILNLAFVEAFGDLHEGDLHEDIEE
jgi:hypothetical protein